MAEETALERPATKLTTRSLFNRDDIKQKFNELLGKRSPAFITSVLQIVSQSDLLAKADPMSVYQCAAMAATLDMPLNANIGHSYIIPFKEKSGNVKAQFIIGYKGFKQLALRTGLYKTINATDVREGEIVKNDKLSGEIEFNWIENEEIRNSKAVVGYASHFALLTGFTSTLYMTVGELKAHGKKYSQTFKKGYGLWVDDFDSMAKKTLLKLNLSKNGPLSVEMQQAIQADQAIINDAETTDVTYIDHDEPEEKITIEQLQDLYKEKIGELNKEEMDSAKRIIETQESASYKFLFAKRLGIEYVPNFDDTKVHPIFPNWAGTCDCKRQDTVVEIKSPFTAESFCKLVDPLYNGLEGLSAFNALRSGYKNKAGLEVKKHTDAEKYYWQCLSNACLERLPKAELLIFCPYFSDLPELADFISNLDDVDLQIRAEWIHSAIINENYDALPWIPDGGFYKSLNAIVFDVPDADRILLTYRVQQLSPLLIKRN